MGALTLHDLDEIRKQGLRPTIVGCFVNDKKVLLVFHEEYNLWQLPQGGVGNNEEAEKALQRELREELGEDLVMYAKRKPNYMGRDQIVFKESKHGMRELQTDDGKPVKMQGKCYLFYAIEVPVTQLDMEASEFDNYKWVSYDSALATAEEIYQPGKQRITQKAIELLNEQGFIE